MSRLVVLGVVSGLLVAGLTAARPASATTTTPAAPGSYVPLGPKRVVDTRVGLGVSKGAVAGGHTVLGALAGVPSTASAVLVTVTAVSGTVVGGLTLFKPASTRPGTTNLLYAKNQVVSDTAVVRVTSSKLDIYNSASSGSVQIIIDLAGYYVGGTVTGNPGLLHTVAPSRVVNTAAHLNATGPIAAHGYSTPLLAGKASIPASGVAAVAVTISVVSATQTGSVIAYDGGTRPIESTMHFTAGQRTAAFAVVALSASGKIVLYNNSSASIQLTVDVAGWYFSSAPTAVAGGVQPLPVARVYGNPVTTVGANSTTSVLIKGRGGVPLNPALVSAVLLVVHASSPAASGGFIVYPGGTVPGVRNVSWAAHQTTSNVVLARLSTAGTVSIRNSSSGSTGLTADVYGYVMAVAAPPAPSAFISRNVRGLGGSFQDGSGTGDGCMDAHAGYRFVLLHIGAQLNDKSGVQLNATSINVAYPALVTALNNYIQAFAGCGGIGTIAVATSNSAADWTSYTAAQRGSDWATKVLNLLPNGGTNGFVGPQVVGAFDAEPDFGTTHLSDAQGWETAFLSNATHQTMHGASAIASGAKLIFTGSADGCPAAFGTTTGCNNGWTPAALYSLAHNGTQILALPQIYVPNQANQWANIDHVGGGGMIFAGSLTQHAACVAVPAGCTSMTASQGWTALHSALTGVSSAVTLPYSIDLTITDTTP